MTVLIGSDVFTDYLFYDIKESVLDGGDPFGIFASLVTPALVGGVLIHSLPQTTPRNLSGVLLKSVGIDYLDLIIYLPRLDLGSVTEDTDFYPTLDNRWSVNKVLTGVTTTCPAITAISIVPQTIPAMGTLVVELLAALEGSEDIDCTVTYHVSDVGGGNPIALVATIVGRREPPRQLASFRQSSEKRVWLTDIINTKTQELRSAVRPIPRLVLDYKLIVEDTPTYAYAKALAKKDIGSTLTLPLWVKAKEIGIVTEGESVFNVDTTSMELRIGDWFILWRREGSHHSAKVTNFTSASVTLERAAGFTSINSWGMPMAEGRVISAIKLSRSGRRYRYSLQVQVVNPAVTDTYSPEIFEGAGILDVKGLLPKSVNEGVVQVSKSFDSIQGDYEKLVGQDAIRSKGGFILKATTSAELVTMYSVLNYLKGRLTSFWLPTYLAEISIIAPMVGGVYTVEVAPMYLDRTTEAQAIRVEHTGGAEFLLLDIDTTGHSSMVTELTFTSPIAVAIDLEDIVSTCYVKKYRSNSDSITIKHKNANRLLATVTIPVLEEV